MHINMSLFKDGKTPSTTLTTRWGCRTWRTASLRACSNTRAVYHHQSAGQLLRRLVPGYEAPVYVAWSARNRSPLVRIPSARGNGTRIELRNPDPSCNPYLALATVLWAGLDGIAKRPDAAALGGQQHLPYERGGSLPRTCTICPAR